MTSAARLPLTACIIAFNEQDRIEDCLRSVAFCSHLLVVDSHSKDRTRELAASHGARVIERAWQGHIEQKNFAIDQATTDWVLCIDADERVTPTLRAEIERIFAAGPPLDGYSLRRRTFYLGRFIDHGGFYPDCKLRLFRRALGRWGGTNPHDHLALAPGAKQGAIAQDLHHFSYRSIADHLKTIDYFTTIAAREKLTRGQRGLLAHLVFAPPWKFFKMFVLQRGFLDGIAGFIVALLGSYYAFLKYAKLWELRVVVGARPGTGEKVVYGRKGEDREPAS